MTEYTVMDLCCGAGGFSEGFRQVGFKIILGIDIWVTALETYKYNQNCETICIDIKDKSIFGMIPKCDIFIGSPPCQGFSKQKYAGKKEQQQKEDVSIFETFCEIYRISGAKYWIWENTPRVIKYVKLPHMILNSQNYNVPQRRTRVFFGNYPSPIKHPFVGKVCPTIIAQELCGGFKNTYSRRFSQWLNRAPTIEEMKYYMGFDEKYKFFGKKQDQSIQIGNSVCPPVSRAIAEAIKLELGSETKSKRFGYNPNMIRKSLFDF